MAKDFQEIFIRNVKAAAVKTLKPSLGTIRFLILVMLPVSLGVLILEESGLLGVIASLLNPPMRFFGLRGEAALVLLSSVLINIYSAIAVLGTLNLSGREILILSTMCCIAHGFFVECIVMKKTGSSLPKMILLRLFWALAAGFLLHLILPGEIGPASSSLIRIPKTAGPAAFSPGHFVPAVFLWLFDSLMLVLRTTLIVFTVVFIQMLLGEFGFLKFLARLFSPLMAAMGFQANTAYLWIVVNVIGVVYGSASIIEEVKAGSLPEKEADLLNHYAAISHAQIEDTALFVSLGLPYVWVALPRFFLAILVVWIEKGRRFLFRRSFRVRIDG
ncbi:MAG: transporter [Treponema sp.]|nr:transporter [Treponema sp.]